MEVFPFVSAFFTIYRCCQIMDAKEAPLSFKDVVKVWVRKFLRLAPAYYSLWLVFYVVTPRIINTSNGWVADQ